MKKFIHSKLTEPAIKQIGGLCHLMSDFNNCIPCRHPLRPKGGCWHVGLCDWEGCSWFISGITKASASLLGKPKFDSFILK